MDEKERRRQMMQTNEGQLELRNEILGIMQGCIEDLIELSARGAWATSFAQLEEAENCLLDMLVECDPGNLLAEIRRLSNLPV